MKKIIADPWQWYGKFLFSLKYESPITVIDVLVFKYNTRRAPQRDPTLFVKAQFIISAFTEKVCCTYNKLSPAIDEGGCWDTEGVRGVSIKNTGVFKNITLFL